MRRGGSVLLSIQLDGIKHRFNYSGKLNVPYNAYRLDKELLAICDGIVIAAIAVFLDKLPLSIYNKTA